jgi:hypothetical protein
MMDRPRPGEKKGFVEEMRFVAMKLHTKEQAPKEGAQPADLCQTPTSVGEPLNKPGFRTPPQQLGSNSRPTCGFRASFRTPTMRGTRPAPLGRLGRERGAPCAAAADVGGGGGGGGEVRAGEAKVSEEQQKSMMDWKPTREGYLQFLAESCVMYEALEGIMADAADASCARLPQPVALPSFPPPPPSPPTAGELLGALPERNGASQRFLTAYMPRLPTVHGARAAWRLSIQGGAR